MGTPRFTDDEQWFAEQLTNCKTDADWDALGPSLQAEICELVERRPDVFEKSSRAGTLRSKISDLSHLSQLSPTPSIPNPLFRSKYADTVNRGFWDAEADRPRGADGGGRARDEPEYICYGVGGVGNYGGSHGPGRFCAGGKAETTEAAQ
ncbi:uncharacterized protein FTOL_12982 [Fusarium torulosum]|uniref:Uncharacterized protein n=1 Tax=Fusarium torulosum TaxID=33205 RepID=A0AAE8MKY6_9HYPO|nr:uncharacterized protein FTOL_12982 [Fusarium torulosum]